MDKLEEFLENSYRKTTSRNSMRSNLRKFFNFLEISPDEYIVDDARRLDRDRRIDLFDSIQNDIKKFAISIQDKPQKTQIAYISALKKYLEYQYIDLPTRFWNEVKSRNGVKNPRAVSEKRTPNPSELELILQYGDTKDKAFFLLMASSGVRIGEAVTLTMDDIDIKKRILRVRDYLNKGRYNRYSLFTEECQKLLKAWIKQRADYVKTGYKKSKQLRKKLGEKGYTFQHENLEWIAFKDGQRVSFESIIEEDNRLFPYDANTMRQGWYRLLRKAGYDQTDKSLGMKYARKKYSPHCLRRYFETYLRSAGMRKDYIDFMIGHESRLDQAYTDYSVFERMIKSEYDKYCDALNVFSDYSKIKTKIEPKLDAMKMNISSLVSTNQKLEEEKSAQEQRLIQMQGRMRELEDYIFDKESADRYLKQEETNRFIRNAIEREIKTLVQVGYDEAELKKRLNME